MRHSVLRWLRSPHFATVLLLLGWLLVAAGYWGPWVPAAAAGLRVLGLDLAEYVKFVAEVRSGQIALTREVFYLPLVALSVSLSLLAHRSELRLPRWARWMLNLLAAPAALAMLPPAWTPSLLTTPEFVKQTAAMAICLLLALLSYPLLRLCSPSPASPRPWMRSTPSACPLAAVYGRCRWALPCCCWERCWPSAAATSNFCRLSPPHVQAIHPKNSRSTQPRRFAWV